VFLQSNTIDHPSRKCHVTGDITRRWWIDDDRRTHTVPKPSHLSCDVVDGRNVMLLGASKNGSIKKY